MLRDTIKLSNKKIYNEFSNSLSAFKLDKFKIPDDIDYSSIDHISSETRDKLSKIRPKTLAQASRIGGVKPADISILMVMLERHQFSRL